MGSTVSKNVHNYIEETINTKVRIIFYSPLKKTLPKSGL